MNIEVNLNAEVETERFRTAIAAALENFHQLTAKEVAQHTKDFALELINSQRQGLINCSIENCAGVIGFRRDQRARVWLKMTDGSERRGKRFMSLRVAKLWGKRQIGKFYYDISFARALPVKVWHIDFSLSTTNEKEAQA